MPTYGTAFDIALNSPDMGFILLLFAAKGLIRKRKVIGEGIWITGFYVVSPGLKIGYVKRLGDLRLEVCRG
jgi:hypothetical protein